MRKGLSWGAQPPHQVTVAGIRYEVRTTKISGVWTAYGEVNGVLVEASGSSERAARQKWQKTVQAMSPLLCIERRVEAALDEASAALDEAAQSIAAAESRATPANEPPGLPPETCETPRRVDRRLTRRPRREH